MSFEYGKTCLIEAIDGKHIEVVKCLLRIKEVDLGLSLHMASSYRNYINSNCSPRVKTLPVT